MFVCNTAVTPLLDSVTFMHSIHSLLNMDRWEQARGLMAQWIHPQQSTIDKRQIGQIGIHKGMVPKTRAVLQAHT